jgi:hypothetical protein
MGRKEDNSKCNGKEKNMGITLEDANLVAYLNYIGYQFAPTKKKSGKVVFKIEGEEGNIEKDIEKFYSDDTVRINDYIKCLKNVRSSIFNLRNQKETDYESKR